MITTTVPDSSAANAGAGQEDLRSRLQSDLEFVQCLSNPSFCHHLAATGQLEDPVFLGYLRYLQYFHQPPYARLIAYPLCLLTLSALVSSPTCREALRDPRFVAELDADMLKAFLQ